MQFVKDVKKFKADCELYEKAYEAGDWHEAIKHLNDAIKFDDTEHWVWNQFAIMYLNIDDYSKALKAAEKSYRLTKKCPEALFYYGYCLELNAKYAEAKTIYRKIINRGIETLSYGVCGEGLRYGRGYYLDSIYRLGKCYQAEGKKRLAKKYIQTHLDQRGPGMISIFSKKEVLKNLNAIDK